MKITAKTKICMIIGDPVEHSLSPQMHNAGYVALEIDDQYVYVAAHVTKAELKDLITGIRAMNVKGLTLTKPHKTTVIEYLDSIDETAKTIGAVNTVVNVDGKLKGYNTDWLGVIHPLEKRVNLKGAKIALLGAGGAARAAAYGFTKKGAIVTIFNRTIESAQKVAEEFGCDVASFEEFEKIKSMDIIFNATSVGLNATDNQTPLAKEYITKSHIVFDAIYAPYETQLLKDAKEQGATIIHGLEMLLFQGLEQFKIFTGHNGPEDAMRTVLMKHTN